MQCAVVHPASRSALARELGVTRGQLDAVLAGESAFVRARDTAMVIGEFEAYPGFTDIDFHACTLADASRRSLLRWCCDTFRSNPSVWVGGTPPIDDVDALYIDL